MVEVKCNYEIKEKSFVNNSNLMNLEDVYDLSPCQLDDLKKYIDSPTEGWFHENLVFEFHGKIDVEIFRECWEKILKCHSILRTGFLFNNLEKPVQAVFKDVKLPLEILNWHELDEGKRNEQFDKLIQEDKLIPYQLEKAPLMRLSLILCPNDHFILWWRFHHLLMDGWSFSIVLFNFFALYRECLGVKSDGDTIPLYPFKDYIYYRKLRETSGEETFWKEYFKDFDIQKMIEKKDRPSSNNLVRLAKQGRVDIELSDLYHELKHIMKDNGLSMNTIFQGVFTLLSNDYCNQDGDIVTGQVVADRSLKLENSHKRVGLFVNTLPIRAKIQENIKFSDWLKDLQVSMLNVFQYSVSSEQEIKKWINVPMEKDLFQNVLVFENVPLAGDPCEGLPFDILKYNLESHPCYPLILFVWPDENLHFKAVYNNEIYSKEVITGFLKKFRLRLENFIKDPELLMTSLTSPIKTLRKE
ncbi:hypothetical protein E4V42_21995 [Clostridium estertheticum]|uniref:Condensation domain-containing protein n=1 Tax=Clostridium estertheticum TaxID=238834 RepID=A0A5N7J7Z3_9CLOT|nr:condensation domain-containing protein [Clostridium estertheticum]MPQ34067.1 hypothetical protein [Clostridium estertheticum]MPQ64868.1 hypothetical protein [Clostridium estertheticum]